MNVDFAATKAVIDGKLNELISSLNTEEGLKAAITYALQSGGKRIRPVLCCLAAESCGGTCDEALPFALAVELIHNYSLIHDDLPAMDDDDMRRGRPTVHKKFDEATAILAGDALLNLAFELLFSELSVQSAQNKVRAAAVIANAAGLCGMIKGQALDINAARGRSEDIFEINKYKTGALIKAAVLSGAYAVGASEDKIASLTVYAEKLGEAFQIADDVLDYEGGERTPANYANAYGIDAARQYLNELTASAKAAVDGEDKLTAYADYLCGRDF